MLTCPACSAKGKAVPAVTIERHVRPSRGPQVNQTGVNSVDVNQVDHPDQGHQSPTGAHEGWALCLDRTCDVVYFRERDTVVRADVRTLPFHKSDDPDRVVCFCLTHTARAIVEDLADNGGSTIQASIQEVCRQGKSDCARENPQGRCCLGNVGQVLRAAAGGTAGGPPEATSDDDLPAGAASLGGAADDDACAGGCCCAADAAPVDDVQPERDTPDTRAKRGMLAAGGALLAAALSSACCWLPLLLISLGASAAGVGALFEAWRVPFLAATAVLLVVGFVLAYRTPACAPGQACCTPHPRLQRLNKTMLWICAAFVAAFAFFPEAMFALTGSERGLATASAAQTKRTYALEGMTCAGCVKLAQDAVEPLAGVAAVSVSYDEQRAWVLFDGAPDDDSVSAALQEVGITARVLEDR